MVPTYTNSLCGLTMEVSTFWFLTLKGHPPKCSAACVISMVKRQSCISRTQTELLRMSAGYKLSLCATIFICFVPYSLSLLTLPLPLYSENLVLDQQIIPNWYFSLFSSLFCLLLYWYCKEKVCVGHSWKLMGPLFIHFRDVHRALMLLNP